MASDFPQQPKNALWAMQKLAVIKAGRVCTAPLVDTVLFDENGHPQVWIHQGKEGGVERRKEVTDSAVIETFKRQSLSHANNIHKFCAIAHYKDGSHRTLTEDAFGSFMVNFSAGVKDCEGLQCYVHARGGDGAIFRNEYAIQNLAYAEVSMSTWKLSKYLLNVSDAEVQESLTRSHSEGVNKLVGRITEEVAAHLEAVSKSRVTKLVCDYVLDEQDEPQLLWVHDILVAPRLVVPAHGASTSKGQAADDPSLTLSESTFADRRHRQDEEEKKADDVYATFDEIVGRAVGEGWRGKICICDSDAMASVTAMEALAEQGYSITVVADGPKALQATRDENFDALLIARDLPSVSGVEVTRIIRQREGALAHTTPGTLQMRLPIIAFTEHTTAEDLRIYMEVGMDGCICKPLEIGSLLNTVAAAVPMTEGRAPPAAGHAEEGKVPNSASEYSMTMSRTLPSGKQSSGRTHKLPPSSPVGTGTKLADTRKSTRRQRGRVTQGPPVINSAMEAPVSEQGDVISGVFQLDAETAIPYAILGKSMEGAPVFHFVVIQDIFETCEVWQIFFRKIVAKYPGMRVLLFNYPGQAFTEWRKDATLNNEYLAGVTEALLGYLSKHGNGEFALEDGQAPFYLMGVGNGGAIASSFVTTYMGRHPNLRGLLLLNGHFYLDAHLAGVYHDCMNVFACTPASRPDLPVYFFSRYLFSPTYLSKVGAPLALNLYTAVHNPITLEGRIQLCQGALSHVDVRDSIERLSLPIISVASSKDGFVKPLHVQAAISCRGGEERSIKRVLTTRRRVCVIWLRAGHELLQEARRPLSNLVEQLATGYHERNDVAFLPLAPEEPSLAGGTRGYQPPSLAAKAAARATQRAGAMAQELEGMQNRDTAISGLTPGQPTDQAQLYEDKYLNDVVNTLHDAQGRSESKVKDGNMMTMVEELEAHKKLIDGGVKSMGGSNKMGKASAMGGYGDEADYQAMAAKQYAGADATQTTSYPVALDDAPPVPDELKEWQAAIARGEKPKVREPRAPFSGMGFDGAGTGGRKRTSLARAKAKREEMRRLNIELNLDPEAAMFERRDNDTSVAAPAATPAHPEVREYMAWRLKRNKKRYTRIVQKVEMIQRAWRSYLSRTLLVRMRQQRSALNMQRWWRGCMGRKRVAHMRREHWAAHVVQRYWRGFAGRGLAWKMQLEERSAKLIQKCWRGWRARRFVNLLRFARRDAAIKIQSMWRQRTAMRDAWAMRDRHNAAVNIQRVFRGRLGRARAKREREKYLFSKSQSQSIEFGRQMLMEHKLHATKLQSEVSILTKEKIETEEAVEMVLKEIATFEAGVRALEKEMIDLSRAEAEAAGTLDEEAKLELRENKMRLDREFGAMLVKIADRREKLQGLEKKLQRIDATREAKKEELQDLERKLVVLLEEQQRELKAIKVRQTRKGERLVDDAVKAVQETLASGGKTPLQIGSGANGGGANGSQSGVTDLSEMGGGPTPQQRAEANALMSSTETMMKFGFMSMSMTYFSSLNMIRAMRQVGTANTVLSNPMLAGGTMSALNKGLVGQGSLMDGSGGTAASFQPGLKPGQVAGQETSDVSLWTVGDVANWLDTLSLGQYKDAFADAAVDGAFMFDLTDDDLRSTLGIEHALHRKKILSAISRLRTREREARAASEAASMSASAMMMRGDGASIMGGGPSGMLGPMSSIGPSASMAAGRVQDQGYGQYGDGTVLSNQDSGSMLTGPVQAAATGIKFQDMMQWVSFGKAKKVANALRTLPEQKFDLGLLKAQFVDGFGSQYDDSLNALDFHTNMADEHGNTLLLKCAQSGQGHLAKLLVQHGAYINHQNARGNTALHFALMYKDTDLAVWLADPEKGGIDDTLLNTDGLSAYDGLSAED